MPDTMRPGGVVKDALLAINARKLGAIDDELLAEAFRRVEWENFPQLLPIVLTSATKRMIAGAYRAVFGRPIPELE